MAKWAGAGNCRFEKITVIVRRSRPDVTSESCGLRRLFLKKASNRRAAQKGSSRWQMAINAAATKARLGPPLHHAVMAIFLLVKP